VGQFVIAAPARRREISWFGFVNSFQERSEEAFTREQLNRKIIGSKRR